MRFGPVCPMLRVVSALASCLAARDTSAHRDDYINETFVFQTLEAHEFEPEIWLDAGTQGPEGSFWRYAAAFEYGVSHHFMVDGFAGWTDPSHASPSFERGRAEARLRFGEEGDRPVDVAA